MKIIQYIAIALIILSNIFFLPVTITIIATDGGTWGFGILLLPITISINLLLVTVVLSFTKRFKKSLFLTIVNCVGAVWSTFWFYTFYSI